MCVTQLITNILIKHGTLYEAWNANVKFSIMQYRQLGKARTVIERIGLEIMHAYDDLIFVNHTAFLFRFDDEDQSNLFLHFNKECDIAEKNEYIKVLEKETKFAGLSLLRGADFKMQQAEGKEEIEISFGSN